MTSHQPATSHQPFIVYCADDIRRHDVPFASVADAIVWADLGHCCMAQHVAVNETNGRTVRIPAN